MDQNEEIMRSLSTPEAVKSMDHDLLGRENIVTAISNKIKERSKNDIFCEVIGVYGKWGEGKSTVLNFVKESLENQEIGTGKKINVIDFNPWLFQDHESMLLDFFKVLQTGFTGEGLKKTLKQYGPLVALGTKGLLNLTLPMFASVTNTVIDKVFESISNSEVNLKSLKDEIDNQIKLSKRHYVIFIDDVDRLDQEELHALFKLIKQNADFVNTTYVVSMDADMVASSIGHRFEDGSKEAGCNFLEKIVQYPVHLPKVQHSKMRNVFEKLIVAEFEKYYKEGGSPTMQPLEVLKHSLRDYILPLFDTVREMILYRNAISFLLPTVYREVNLSDFAMLEAIKMFHKEGYELIRNNKKVVFHKWDIDIKEVPQSIVEFKSSLRESVHKTSKPSLSNVIDELIIPLNHYIYYPGKRDKVMDKRLFTLEYFDNYFLYDLSEHKISDKEIDKFISGITTDELENIYVSLRELLLLYGMDNLKSFIKQVVDRVLLGMTLSQRYDVVRKVVHSLLKIAIDSDSDKEIKDDLTEHCKDLLFEYIKDINGIIIEVEMSKIVDSILLHEESDLALLEFVLKLIHQTNIINGDFELLQKTIYSYIIRYNTEKGLEDLFNLYYILTVRAFMLWQKQNEAEYKRETEKFMFSERFDLVGFINKMAPNNVADKKVVLYKLFDMDKIYDKLKHLIKTDDDENNGVRELLQHHEYEKK